MLFVARYLAITLVFLAGAQSLWGASKAEERAFGTAVQAFTDGLWERADRELGLFVETYPKADNSAEAVLLRAQARLKLKNVQGAIELLEAGRTNTTRLADEYLFWLAESRLQAGQPEAAADLYSQFTTQFTNSSRLLEVVVGEATVRAQLKQWDRVREILQKPDGIFQSRAKETPSQPIIVRGLFLLARTHADLGQLKEAEAALLPVANVALSPRLAWDRDYLLAQIQRRDQRPGEALKLAAKLPSLVTNEPPRVAEGWAMVARCEEDLNHGDQAVLAWQEVLKTPGAPAEGQREALLRVGELLLTQNRIAESLQTLESFLNTASNSPVADIAWLAVGELRLRQFATGNVSATTNSASASNQIASAQSAFDTLLAQFPHSPLVGKAHLGRGWTLWIAERIEDSAKAFESATATLPAGYEQIVARFKLADSQARQNNFTNALGHYQSVVASGATLPEVRSNLVEHALYQILQIAPEAGDDAAASDAMGRLLAEFPEGPFAEPGLLTFGTLRGGVRTVLEEFLRRSPESKLAAGVRLAIARTYEQERDWAKAQAEYGAILSASPEPALQARAQYYQALAAARSGDQTNALTLFTNFVATFPTNEFTPLARWWVAEHFWSEEDYSSAERNFQYLFQNHPESSLRFEAQLQAGHAAFLRRPEAAVEYFTSLANNAQCPSNIQAKALFAYGDTQMALTNYVVAAQVFSRVQKTSPDPQLSLLALGKEGQCYFQIGASDPLKYKFARDAFNKLMLSPANISARSEAEWGLAQVMEKETLPTSSTNQNVVLQQALDHYVNVVYGKNLRANEEADPYWVKRAGQDAVRLAESLQLWDVLVNKETGGGLCETLSNLLPPLRPFLERKKARALEQLSKNENSVR